MWLPCQRLATSPPAVPPMPELASCGYAGLQAAKPYYFRKIFKSLGLWIPAIPATWGGNGPASFRTQGSRMVKPKGNLLETLEAVTETYLRKCPMQYPMIPATTLLIPAVTACFANSSRFLTKNDAELRFVSRFK
jgi:hypothetical protein